MTPQKMARFSLWLAGLALAACTSAPPDAESVTAGREQAISRIACSSTADCDARGGACRGGVCRADNECATDADCAAGSGCAFDSNFGGLCQDIEELSPTPLPARPCSSAGLCPAGQVCGADGVCRSGRHCKADSDCPKGKICNPATKQCTGPTPTPRCHRNNDCPTGQVCDVATGQCTGGPHCIPLPDGTCCDPATGTVCPTRSCTTDHDCPTTMACRQPDPSSPLHYCVPR